mmetsp:Transcript_9753/g.35734  ORF Transcript_9753/g.35734 Transcript_9753/m.35734 type:complete len:119 (-) Transcript_9753:110-466(-)
MKQEASLVLDIVSKGRRMFGKVVSNKMQKTIVVAVDSFRIHPKYKRQIRRTRKFKAHDEDNICNIGDTVEIVESRPISKDKHFRLAKVMHRNPEFMSPAAAAAFSSPPEAPPPDKNAT